MKIPDNEIRSFRKTIWNFYKKHKRNPIWREHITPYNVFVSEIMLQQTQVSRVMVKFLDFIKVFPDFRSLARAQTKILLKTWQGMGYNRRALYLRDSAKIILEKYNGKVPVNSEVLETLPGIGKTTACSITTFITNKSTIFIETNIRRTFIHHFFQDRSVISDKEILPFVEKSLDRKKPRDWYYALMDYGSSLPKKITNPNRKSKHYVKQKSFRGSDRQVRGMLLRLLLKNPLSTEQLEKQSGFASERVMYNLTNLEKEGFIMGKQGKYMIK